MQMEERSRKQALVFPGQGSQEVGMGHDLAQAYPQARRLYKQADAILGFPLSSLCFEGPKEELDDTFNTQPALFVTSLATMQVLEAEGKLALTAMLAGHSLGELTALAAAGAMDFDQGIRLVRERGRLMKVAGEKNPGGMAAVIKTKDTQVEKACRQASEEANAPLQVANYNSPGQVVISGDRAALERAIELLREAGVRRIMPLAVSIAAHSPLMDSIVHQFRAVLERIPFRTPQNTVVGNIYARPLRTVDEIRDELAWQLTRPVQWAASVEWMVQQGVTRFLEIGPKDVLSRLVQRTEPTVEAISIGSVASVDALVT